MYLIHDVQIAIYLADANGLAVGEVWLGGSVEKLEPELRFDSRRIDRHGNPYGRVRHVDESHSFTIENLWIERRTAAVEIPAVRRNQRYVVAIRFIDPETGVFTDRTYFGATMDGQRLSHPAEVFYQSVSIVAQRMVEVSGINPVTPLAPANFGVVRYVSPSETVDLYRYDYGNAQYNVIDAGLLPGRASISVGTTTEILFGAIVALSANDDTLTVAKLSAFGSSFPIQEHLPRLEFLSGGSRVASLTSAGELAVSGLEEVDLPPSWPMSFRMFAGAEWVASIGLLGARSPNFVEGL